MSGSAPSPVERTGPEPDSPVTGMGDFTHCYADVNGTRIHYVVGGEGPVVVLLHGFPYGWATWRDIMPQLAMAGFTVLAPDLRAMGDSAPAEDGFAKMNAVEDVRALVRERGPVRLVGTDIGTMVAFAYALKHPDEVARLVLAESVLPGFGLEELMNPATGGYWHFGFHMQVDLASFLTRGKEAAYLLPLYKMMSTSADAEELARSIFLPLYAGPEGLRGGLQHYGPLLEDGRANRAAFTARLPMPVLILNGDKGLPQHQLLDGVRTVAEQVEADLVPASGHAFAHDNPAWTAQRLIRFLE